MLETLTRLAAPMLPMASEVIWKSLTGGRSVHLEPWPTADELSDDAALVAAMDDVRAVCSAASQTAAVSAVVSGASVPRPSRDTR